MTNEVALWLSIGAGALAILFGIISTQWIIKQPTGNSRMQEIQAAIQEGANAYMNRQYTTIGAVGAWALCSSGRQHLVSPSVPYCQHWPATSACTFQCAPM